MFDNVRIAIISLRSNKLRAALTMLGITIGVAAVIVLISVGQAIEDFILGQFEGIGTDTVAVFGEFTDDGEFLELRERDLRALQDPFRVPAAVNAVPALFLAETITYEDRELVDTFVLGVTPDYGEVGNREAVVGRFITQDDIDGATRSVWLGQKVADRLFPGQIPVGQTVRIRNVPFRVEGVLNEAGGSAFGDQDEIALIPLTTGQQRFAEARLSGEEPITQIIVQARTPEEVPEMARQIRQTLREERDIDFQGEDDFQVFTSQQLLDSVSTITGLLTIFLGVIAGISLLVGGIGIMNIMLVTVTERTREIGLRKAVGAQRSDIVMQFLTEAVVIALIGGFIGISIAVGAASVASRAIEALTVSVETSSVILATSISIGIGVFFGLYPANRAASLDPIDALRYE